MTTAMCSSGQSKCLASIVVCLVLHVVLLDDSRWEGSLSSPLPKLLDLSELISSSSDDDDDDDDKLSWSESAASDSMTDAARFLFPFWALEGAALHGTCFFEI